MKEPFLCLISGLRQLFLRRKCCRWCYCLSLSLSCSLSANGRQEYCSVILSLSSVGSAELFIYIYISSPSSLRTQKRIRACAAAVLRPCELPHDSQRSASQALLLARSQLSPLILLLLLVQVPLESKSAPLPRPTYRLKRVTMGRHRDGSSRPLRLSISRLDRLPPASL